MFRAACLALTVTAIGAAPVAASERPDAPASQNPPPLSAAVARAAKDAVPGALAWTVDRAAARPAALPALYGTYAALQALDFYTTKRALGAAATATEANPLMKGGSTAAMMAVKAAAGAGTIFFTERAWKKNRAGAIVLMAALNGATAAIVARNAHHAAR